MNDQAQLSGILSGLYDCVIDPSQWPSALGQMSEFVGGSSALLFHQDFLAKSGNFLQSHNADPQWTRLYFEKYIGLNPVIPYTAFMDVGSTTAFSRLIDLDEFRGSRFYMEWAAPQRFLDVVVTILDKSATAMGLFAVTRMDHEGPAGDPEIARMTLVAPHVRRAVTITRMFEHLQRRAEAFRSAIDALSDAVFFLDAGGKVLFANSAAHLAASAGGPLRLVDSTLVIDDPRAAASVRSAARSAAAGDIGSGAATVDFGSNDEKGDRWIGSLLPLAGGRQVKKAPDNTAALLFVRRVGAEVPPPMDTLAKLYGFTPRELQVFLGIVQFGGVPEVARMYGLSPTTVRSHLQKIFDKTGVRRQADLSRIAASMLSPPGSPPEG